MDRIYNSSFASEVADCVSGSIQQDWDQKDHKSPPSDPFDHSPERILYNGKQPYACVEGNPAVRPGDLPAHCFVPSELTENHGIDNVLPCTLNLI